MEQTMSQDATAGMMTGGTQKKNTGLIVGMVACAVLAVGGIAFGVYGMTQSSQKDNQISDLKVQVADKDGTITTLEAEKIETTKENGTTTVTISDSPTISEEDLFHYIYVAQWDLKIKLPATLGGFSYRYYMMPGYTSLGVSGTSCKEQGQCQYAPEFANLSTTNFPLGTINRFYAGTEPSIGSGEKVFTIDNYDYYYVHPQAVYSQDQSEVNWEAESVNLIKEILTNRDNYSKI